MENNDQRHYAVADAYKRKVTLKYQDKVIVESENARILKEVGKSVYNPVLYFPKDDIKVPLEKEEARQSHCPIKGDATYWNFPEQPTSEYLAWSYETALPKTKKIEGLVAFNLNYFTLISEPLNS